MSPGLGTKERPFVNSFDCVAVGEKCSDRLKMFWFVDVWVGPGICFILKKLSRTPTSCQPCLGTNESYRLVCEIVSVQVVGCVFQWP